MVLSAVALVLVSANTITVVKVLAPELSNTYASDFNSFDKFLWSIAIHGPLFSYIRNSYSTVVRDLTYGSKPPRPRATA